MFGPRVRVVHDDMLRFRLDGVHHVVSNVPFGITTPVLRHLLAQRAWSTAVLLLQWEVARKRAAVGGTTLLTASWWPWYEFALAGRVPSTAFRPRPGVDGGILVVGRRPAAGIAGGAIGPGGVPAPGARGVPW
jgi:23S rRNA (adenine-N6)-dimethyltransferase